MMHGNSNIKFSVQLVSGIKWKVQTGRQTGKLVEIMKYKNFPKI